MSFGPAGCMGHHQSGELGASHSGSRNNPITRLQEQQESSRSLKCASLSQGPDDQREGFNMPLPSLAFSLRPRTRPPGPGVFSSLVVLSSLQSTGERLRGRSYRTGQSCPQRPGGHPLTSTNAKDKPPGASGHQNAGRTARSPRSKENDTIKHACIVKK